MAQDHRLQAQRFELKYLVTDKVAPAMRDFISSYLELDDYSAGRPDYSYDIHSIYLDSEDLYTHHATVNGDKNRFKLRLRYYNDVPTAPVYFEIKQRVDNCILKQRCPAHREAVPYLLSGQLPGPEHVASEQPRHLFALQRFHELQQRLDATPRLHNHYLREAWVCPDGNSIRVTFDRKIELEPYFGCRPAVAMSGPRRIYPGLIVFELKFTTRHPNWFRELVERFHLMRSTASKYCGGVEMVGEHRFGEPERVEQSARATSEGLDAIAADLKQF